MIKFNEALSINTSYQQILTKLKEERNAYDNQLQRLEEQVKQKEGELQQMLILSHSANKAKQAIMSDLND